MIYKYIIIVILILIPLIPTLFILYLTITEYRPKEIEDAKTIKNNISTKIKKTMSVTTLNIGYGSLDENQDFFIEGGKGSHCISRIKTNNNIKSIGKLLRQLNSDFYFLQEVDEPCRRSCYVNEVRDLTKRFNDYNSVFVNNYKVKYVPLPLTSPMGGVLSGLLTLSKHKIISSIRFQLNGKEPFFKRIFFLKRCMNINTITVKDGKELILINIHLSAYDKGGYLRKQQIQHLIEYLKEISKTHQYVIVGGDWNHLLDNSKYEEMMPSWVSLLPNELYDTGYKMVYDNSKNTVRSEDKPYVKGENFETIIDGFLVSPAIDVVKVRTFDHGFKYTDHNPVTLTFRLK